MDFLTNGTGKIGGSERLAKRWSDLCADYPDIAAQLLLAEDCGQMMQDFDGVDYALDNRDPDLPLILTSVAPLRIILKRKFRQTMLLLSQAKVIYADMVKGEDLFRHREGLEALVKEAWDKSAHGAGLAYFGMAQRNHDIDEIEHAVNSPERLADPIRCSLAAADARQKLGFIGSDVEVIAQIIGAKKAKDTRLSGRSFPGIFCDVQGALLLDDDKTLNEPLYGWLKKRERHGNTITLWTGADPADMADRLYATEQFEDDFIQWPVVSKNAFADTHVDTAIDDRPALLLDSYHIACQTLINASSFLR